MSTGLLIFLGCLAYLIVATIIVSLWHAWVTIGKGGRQ